MVQCVLETGEVVSPYHLSSPNMGFLLSPGGKYMTLDFIEQIISTIIEYQEDPEVAHAYEDRLYRDFVRFIAVKAPQEYAHLAAAILRTRTLDFPRWCA